MTGPTFIRRSSPGDEWMHSHPFGGPSCPHSYLRSSAFLCGSNSTPSNPVKPRQTFGSRRRTRPIFTQPFASKLVASKLPYFSPPPGQAQSSPVRVVSCSRRRRGDESLNKKKARSTSEKLSRKETAIRPPHSPVAPPPPGCCRSSPVKPLGQAKAPPCHPTLKTAILPSAIVNWLLTVRPSRTQSNLWKMAATALGVWKLELLGMLELPPLPSKFSILHSSFYLPPQHEFAH